MLLLLPVVPVALEMSVLAELPVVPARLPDVLVSREAAVSVVVLPVVSVVLPAAAEPVIEPEALPLVEP